MNLLAPLKLFHGILNKGFRTFIQTYELVLLTECLLEKDYKYPVEEFDCYHFPRKNIRSIQGGGYVALVKKRNIKNIVFVKNQFDSIIWLQIRNFIVLGDFNARTSDKDDFITDDVIKYLKSSLMKQTLYCQRV